MPFPPDRLRAASFDRRLATLLDEARTSLSLDWIAVADFAAPTGLGELSWRAAAPDAPEQLPDRSNVERWLASEGTRAPRAVQLKVSPRLDAHPDALLVFAGREIDPGDLAALQRCLEEGLSEDRRQRLAEWVLAAAEQSYDPMELTDRDATLRWVNASWHRTYGYSRSEMLGRTPRQLFRDRVEPTVDQAFYQFSIGSIEEGHDWVGTLSSQARGGEQVVAEVAVTPFTAGGGDFLGNFAIRRNLSFRGAREGALMAAHREFREVLASMPFGVAVLRDGLIYFVNEAFLAITGRTQEQVIRRAPVELVHDGDRDALAGGLHGTVRVRVVRPGGGMRLVEMSVAASISFEGAPATLYLVRDTTDSRLAEERMAHEKRLEALGLLAAGVAHEINNPLAYLILNLQQLRTTVEAVPGAAQLLADAVEGAHRIQVIADELRGFTSVDNRGPRKSVSVGKAIQSAINLTSNEIRHRARLVRIEAPDLYVLAREGALVQALVAVLTNAAQAIPEGKMPEHTIEIVSRELDAGHVEIAVTDTGVGVPPELVERLFEPFATSTSTGKGLGLAIARRVLAESGGSIAMSGRPRGGTLVAIRLEGAAPRISSASNLRVVPTEQAARARVLVIDDDERVARVLVRLLREHEVEVMCDAVAAAEALRTADADVILCDLMMPDLPGPKLFARVVEARPELADRFIFMSGGAFTDAASQFVDSIGAPVLAKPFDTACVRQRVAEGIARRRAAAPAAGR